jgi:hypothetical protein
MGGPGKRIKAPPARHRPASPAPPPPGSALGYSRPRRRRSPDLFILVSGSRLVPVIHTDERLRSAKEGSTVSPEGNARMNGMQPNMSKNMGAPDRIIRTLIAVALGALIATGRSHGPARRNAPGRRYRPPGPLGIKPPRNADG